MTPYVALSLIAASLLCGYTQAQSTFSCYSCSSDQSGSDSSSCRVASGSTGTAANCLSCSTRVAVGGGGGLPQVYSRNCESVAFTQGCTNTGAVGTCYCNTSMCNNNAFLTTGTLTCYSCTTTYPVDNGCGNVIVPNGIGVYQVSGCTSCVKSVTYSANGPVYVRGCAHQYETDYCGKPGDPGCTFSCRTNLCNSSRRLTVLGSTTAVVAFLGIALIGRLH